MGIVYYLLKDDRRENGRAGGEVLCGEPRCAVPENHQKGVKHEEEDKEADEIPWTAVSAQAPLRMRVVGPEPERAQGRTAVEEPPARVSLRACMAARMDT